MDLRLIFFSGILRPKRVNLVQLAWCGRVEHGSNIITSQSDVGPGIPISRLNLEQVIWIMRSSTNLDKQTPIKIDSCADLASFLLLLLQCNDVQLSSSVTRLHNGRQSSR